MSGLNGFTRMVLRIANWIAGPDQSEWCAAMAAETDAAGSHGAGWALGCIGAAFRMRMRQDWKWIALLFATPLLAEAAQMPWVYVVSWALFADWIGPMTWAVLLQLPLMLALLLVARFSKHGIPWLFSGYAIAVFFLLPGILFAISFGKSPFLFFSPEANWLNLPRNQGMALLGSLLVGSIVAGRLWRNGSIEHAK